MAKVSPEIATSRSRVGVGATREWQDSSQATNNLIKGAVATLWARTQHTREVVVCYLPGLWKGVHFWLGQTQPKSNPTPTQPPAPILRNTFGVKAPRGFGGADTVQLPSPIQTQSNPNPNSAKLQSSTCTLEGIAATAT